MVMESQNMSSKLVKRSHLRSPYTPPISLRYRHETTGGQGTEQSIDKRTGLSQTHHNPLPISQHTDFVKFDPCSPHSSALEALFTPNKQVFTSRVYPQVRCLLPRHANDPDSCVVEHAAVSNRLDSRLYRISVPLPRDGWLRRTSLGRGKLRGYASLLRCICTHVRHAVGFKQSFNG